MEGPAYRTDVPAHAAVSRKQPVSLSSSRREENEPGSKHGFSTGNRQSEPRCTGSRQPELPAFRAGTSTGRPVCSLWQPAARRDSSDYVFKSQLIAVLQRLQQQVIAQQHVGETLPAAAAVRLQQQLRSCCRWRLTTRELLGCTWPCFS